MQKIKKIIVIILVCCILSTIFVGCKTNELDKYDKLIKNNKDPIKLSLWLYYGNVQKLALINLINQFNDTVGLEKKIHIEASFLSSVGELAHKVEDAADKKVGASELPEMFMTYSDDLLALETKHNNVVASLDKYFTQKEKDNYFESFWNEGCYDGHNFKIVPTAKSTEVFMLNKTDFDKFANEYNSKNENKISIDNIKTMEDLLFVSNKYNKQTGKTLFGWDSMANAILASSKSLGKEIIKSGEVTEDKELYKKLFESYLIPYTVGNLGAYDSFRSDDIKSGKLLGSIMSTTAGSYFPKKVILNSQNSYDIESYIMPVPSFANGTKIAIQQGAGIAVTKTTELKEYASIIFLKWLNQKEQSVKFSVESSYLPTTKEGLDALKNAKYNGINEEKVFNATNQIIKDYQLYYASPYANSNKVRLVLENLIYDKYPNQKPSYMEGFINGTDILNEIKNAKTEDDKAKIFAYYHSDAFFEEWYSKSINILKKALDGKI